MDRQEERIPLAEERVKIGKTERAGDRIRVRTVTEESPVLLREALAREDVDIERVPVDAPLDGPADIRTEGDTTIIPIVEERLVVERRLFLVEEVRLTRRVSHETVEAPVTVRRQRAEIERIAADEPTAKDRPMTRTLTAMFDDRAEAAAARDRLAAADFDRGAIRLVDPAAPEPSGDQGGFWSTLVDMFMPDEDRHFYGEGLSRGHVMLAADVPEARAAEACRIVEGTGCVDLEERARDWAAQGWGGRFAGSDAQSGAFGRYDGGNARVRAYRPD